MVEVFIDSPVRYSGDAEKQMREWCYKAGYMVLPVVSLTRVVRFAERIIDDGKKMVVK